MARRRILNETNGYQFKPNRIERDLNRTVVWVVVGVSVRNMTAEELYDAMNEQAVMRAKIEAGLPNKEIPGLRYEPCASGVEATRRESFLTWQAHDFLAQAL